MKFIPKHICPVKSCMRCRNTSARKPDNFFSLHIGSFRILPMSRLRRDKIVILPLVQYVTALVWAIRNSEPHDLQNLLFSCAITCIQGQRKGQEWNKKGTELQSLFNLQANAVNQNK